TVAVHDRGAPLKEINELEYINGVLYANVYRTDWIVRIDPETGEVLGWTNMRGLLPANERTPYTDVLNGIAYDAENDRLFVTGKLWPALFHVRLTTGTSPWAPRGLRPRWAPLRRAPALRGRALRWRSRRRARRARPPSGAAAPNAAARRP